MKQLFGWILLIGIAIATYLAYHHFGADSALSQKMGNGQPTKVKYIEVRSTLIHDEIEALGTAFANEAVNITSTATDKITQLLFEDGQHVKKDQIIAILNIEEELAQKQAQEAQVKEHKRELSRLSELLQKNATAKNEFDARNTLLSISEQRLLEIKARIQDRTIRAPFDGIVGLRKISVGSLVEPGSVITTLDDVSKIKLDFFIPSVYLDVVKEGLQIKATSDSLPNKNFVGSVTKINSRVDAATRSVEVRAILDNPNEIIKPGMLLSVKLLRNHREALLIPEESIIQLQRFHYVLTINSDNKVERQRIQIGQRKKGWVEVISGLEGGNKVIVRGITRVKAGEVVTSEPMDMEMNHAL